ncbi:MAG: hypothetical protein HYX37_16705 [Rhizobiales bacterium]|nr:hypothetical protein [Hyphomicrobiales bacterium]
MAKPVVITIHGVNPDREWQSRVQQVLAPHFDCVGHSYPDYDSSVGPLRAIANILTLTLSIIAFLFSIIQLITQNWMMAAIGFAAFVMLFVLSLILGWRRRLLCAKRLKVAIENTSPSGSPHVIAHSLGTYLIGRVLKTFPDIRLGNVVLVSTVLPRDYPWQWILTQRPACVRNVRSEFGTSDLVVKTVGKIRWLARDLGNAGAYGFYENSTSIHTSLSPTTRCPLCAARPAQIHNVPLLELEHSDEFLGRRHARELWLPFLWGFSPDEFNTYLEDSKEAARLQEEKRWNEVETIIERLWATHFAWSGGNSLKEFVSELVAARVKWGPKLSSNPPIGQIVNEVKSLLHVLTATAIFESVREAPFDENIARALHPNIAIARAVDTIVSEYEIK